MFCIVTARNNNAPDPAIRYSPPLERFFYWPVQELPLVALYPP